MAVIFEQYMAQGARLHWDDVVVFLISKLIYRMMVLGCGLVLPHIENPLWYTLRQSRLKAVTGASEAEICRVGDTFRLRRGPRPNWW